MMYPMPDYADLFTIQEFAECVDSGTFINYDGTGYYATATQMDRDHPVDCSDFKTGVTNTDGVVMTHVAWFNK